MASLLGQPLPAGGDGPIGLARVTDDNGCAVTVILDPRAKNEENPLGGWTALTVLDDRLATISADEKAHRRRWAAWLYWGNIVQFLSDGAGDGDQIAYTNLELFDPHLLVSDAQGRELFRAAHVLLAEPAQPGGGYPVGRFPAANPGTAGPR